MSSILSYLTFLFEWLQQKHPIVLRVFIGSCILADMLSIIGDSISGKWLSLALVVLGLALGALLGLLWTRWTARHAILQEEGINE